jgi:hypothetical protein
MILAGDDLYWTRSAWGFRWGNKQTIPTSAGEITLQTSAGETVNSTLMGLQHFKPGCWGTIHGYLRWGTIIFRLAGELPVLRPAGQILFTTLLGICNQLQACLRRQPWSLLRWGYKPWTCLGQPNLSHYWTVLKFLLNQLWLTCFSQQSKDRDLQNSKTYMPPGIVQTKYTQV